MDVPKRHQWRCKPLHLPANSITSALTTGSRKPFYSQGHPTGGKDESAYLQRSPRPCGWSTALRRCAGSPRSVCKRVDSRTGHSLCAHILSRSKGSVNRTGKLCTHTAVERWDQRLEKARPDGDGLLTLCASSHVPRKRTAFAFPPPPSKPCSAGRLRGRRYLLLPANYKPAGAEHVDGSPQARMEEWP